ncbi:hypothetical protein NUV25_24340 [Burkholderia pseudomultivorans]|uniref:hypothetical protein n=1 Tax=Burkholderia pseudomultivorans TaxID=1207504 RepID=UPI00287700F3|nr:hypothetical protein [Burkholderia pseudomultivorans]MDS0860846.1 hypothetical protein [Burkholderia pseudomultivorans]
MAVQIALQLGSPFGRQLRHALRTIDRPRFRTHRRYRITRPQWRSRAVVPGGSRTVPGSAERPLRCRLAQLGAILPTDLAGAETASFRRAADPSGNDACCRRYPTRYEPH